MSVTTVQNEGKENCLVNTYRKKKTISVSNKPLFVV